MSCSRSRLAASGFARRQCLVQADDFVQQAEHGALAAVRADLHGFTFVEDDASHPVAGVERPPGAQSRDLRCRHRLHCPAAAEEHRAALVDDQQDRPLTLLGVDPHMR
jgi:hypothetical protein